MKVAVSIPDDIFADAEQLSQALGTSRSNVYARALAAFVDDHVPDKVTQAMNAAVDAVGDPAGEFTRQAARQVFDRVEW